MPHGNRLMLFFAQSILPLLILFKRAVYKNFAKLLDIIFLFFYDNEVNLVILP